MDDFIVKPRYPRRNIPARRRKKTSKDTSGIKEKMVLQSIAVVVILIATMAIHSLNNPFSKQMVEKLKYVTEQNLEIKSMYSNINSTLNKLAGNKPTEGEEDAFNQPSIPVNGNLQNTEGDETVKIDYGQGTEQGVETSEQDKSPNGDTGSAKATLFIKPAEGFLTSSFGERIDPITKTAEIHKGLDIGADKGTQIKAALDGEVTTAASDVSFGNYIRLKHQGGYETVYAHCSILKVKKGDTVKKGDVIAEVGDTGAANGPHLHFEIWKDGKAVNPLDYINVPEKK